MGILLNKYFSSVFTKEDINNLPVASTMALGGKDCVLRDLEITEEKIEKAFSKLKRDKAAGVDGIFSTVIIECRSGLVDPLLILFKESFNTGVVPSHWKRANVVPLFKKGSKRDPGNYRPVSLTCHFGKMLEGIIKDEMVRYLEENNILYNTQHGFRKGRSCVTNLLDFVEYVSEYLDEGVPVDVVYLDFQKAFDRVPHVRLISKLIAVGINGKFVEWIKEWLKGREQRVTLNGEASEWVRVDSGVPQGSVLGPVLFSIYINDIDEGLVSKLLKFADDAKVIGKVGTTEQIEELRSDLARMFKWSEDWQMLFNVSKCKIMHLGRSNEKTEYNLGGAVLNTTEEEKDLGVIMDSTFKVGNQCGKAAKKANSILGMISRTFTCRNKKIITGLYKSLVRPHLDYCVQVWRPHLEKDKELLEKVQRRMTRMVQECKGFDYEKRLRIVNLTTLETRRQRADLLEVYKIIRGLEAGNVDALFKFGGDTTRGIHSSCSRRDSGEI